MTFAGAWKAAHTMPFDDYVAAGWPAWIHSAFRYAPSGPAALAARAAINGRPPTPDAKPEQRQRQAESYSPFPALSGQYSTDEDMGDNVVRLADYRGTK